MDSAERIPLVAPSESVILHSPGLGERIPLLPIKEASPISPVLPAEFIGEPTRLPKIVVTNTLKIGIQFQFILRSKYPVQYVFLSQKFPLLNLNEIAFSGIPGVDSFELIYAPTSSVTNIGPSLEFQSQFAFVVQGLPSTALSIHAFDEFGTQVQHTIT
jgi:hypothetical protein